MQKYLITSREFYTDTPAIFRNILHEQFREHMPTYALYRDKSNPNYAIQAAHFVEVCTQFGTIKSFIHQHVDLAKELNATGVHLTSKQFDEIAEAKSKGLEVIDDEEYKKALIKTMKEKARKVKIDNKFEKSAQIIRFAQSRGFEPELIHRYLNEVLK